MPAPAFLVAFTPGFAFAFAPILAFAFTPALAFAFIFAAPFGCACHVSATVPEHVCVCTATVNSRVNVTSPGRSIAHSQADSL